MSDRRVTDAQAKVFAAYDEQDAFTVWYRADPTLEEHAEEDSRDYEFVWLRDLALDLLAERARAERLEAEVEAWREADDLSVKYLLSEWCDAIERVRRLRAANDAQAGAVVSGRYKPGANEEAERG